MPDSNTMPKKIAHLRRFLLLLAVWGVGCGTVLYLWVPPASQAFLPAIAICLFGCLILSFFSHTFGNLLDDYRHALQQFRQQRDILQERLDEQISKFEDQKETTRQLGNDLRESRATGNTLRRQRKELENIFNSMPDAVCVIDNDYTIHYANQALATLLDCDRNALLGAQCFKVWQSPACGKDNCPLQRIANGEKNLVSTCMWEKGPNDSEAIHSISVTPFTDEAGRTGGIIKTVKQSGTGNSPQKTIAERLAHDLNNVFAAVIGHTELALQQAEPDSQLSNNLQKSLQAAQRGQQQITQTRNPLKNITPTPICTRKNARQAIPGGQEKILFVDDEETLVQMTKQFMTELGYQFDGETSSINALERFKKSPHYYDLIITDQSMPRLSGSEMAETMLKIRPDLPIVLCTGYSEDIDKERAKAIGIRSFLLKPVPAPDLARIVRLLLDRKPANVLP